MRTCRLRGIKLGNFEYASAHLQLGQLKGNQFKILMREVSTDNAQQVGLHTQCWQQLLESLLLRRHSFVLSLKALSQEHQAESNHHCQCPGTTLLL